MHGKMKVMSKLYRIVWYEGTIKYNSCNHYDKEGLEQQVNWLNEQYLISRYSVEEVLNDNDTSQSNNNF